jgi:enoyl-CoA hydratase
VSLVRYAVDGAVAVITLDRPPVNALSSALVADLDAAVVRAEDPAVRAVVMTGEPHFAAGADISEFDFSDSGGALGSELSAMILRLERLQKPSIAAIQGFALGGGLELALGCDFRFLADEARVGLPEISLGIFPGAGGTQRLPRVVGLVRARELIYSGRHLTAAEALDIGLADRVVPTTGLMDAAMEAAAEWATGATVAIGAAKRAINDGWGREIEAGLAVEAENFAGVFGTADAAEGIAAFLEKRKADFRGS